MFSCSVLFVALYLAPPPPLCLLSSILFLIWIFKLTSLSFVSASNSSYFSSTCIPPSSSSYVSSSLLWCFLPDHHKPRRGVCPGGQLSEDQVEGDQPHRERGHGPLGVFHRPPSQPGGRGHRQQVRASEHHTASVRTSSRTLLVLLVKERFSNWFWIHDVWTTTAWTLKWNHHRVLEL